MNSKTLWSTGIEGKRLAFFVLLFVAFAAGLTAALQPLLTGQILQVVSTADWEATRTLIIVLAIIFTLNLIFKLTEVWLQARIGGHFASKLRDYSTNRAVYSQAGDSRNLEAGDIHNRILMDTAAAIYPFITAIPTALSATTLLLACIIGMSFISPILFGLVIGVILLTSFLVWIIAKWLRVTTSRVREDTAQYGTALWSLLESLNTLKSRNAQQWSLDYLAKLSNSLRVSGIKTDISSGLIMPILNICTQIALILSIGGATWAMTSGSLSPGYGTSFVMFMLYSISPVVELGGLISGTTAAKVSVSRLQEVWQQPIEHGGKEQVIQSDLDISIAFEDITYTFPDASEPVLNSLNLRFDGPGVYLLRGPNGSGKSTFLSIANGLIPAQGKILINGQDANKLSLDSWRSYVLLVDQERKPLDGTLRDNLGAGLDIGDRQRLRAIKATGFENHYSDLDMPLGETGVTLSGGQRALLALSDALLRAPQVLLLDEITAGVDQASLPTVRSIVDSYAQSHIVIVVSHDDALDSLSHKAVYIR